MRLAGQVVPQRFAKLLEFPLTDIASQGDHRHLVAMSQFRHDRSLGVLGEGVDRVDPGLDLRCQPLHVVVGLCLDDNRTEPLPGGGADFPDPREIVNRLLDPDADLLLDLPRARPRVGQGNIDAIQLEFGEKLLVQCRYAQQAPDHEEHHQQVGGNRVINEPANRPSHGH